MTGHVDQGDRPADRDPAAGRGPEPDSRASTTTSSTGRSASPSRCRWACGTPLANVRQVAVRLLRQRAYLQQVVHQTTHSLARFFLEVDANYKQFKTASRLRAAAAQRLDAQRAFYEEGRITIDRYLDAVSQYASAVAQEAQYKTTYNISIVALEEAKGTLLAYDNIAVAEGPAPAEGVHPGPRPAGGPPAVPDPARRPVPPGADQRPGEPRPDPCPTPPPDARTPRRSRRSADAGPDRPARPAPDAAAAERAGRRARCRSARTSRTGPPAPGRRPAVAPASAATADRPGRRREPSADDDLPPPPGPRSICRRSPQVTCGRVAVTAERPARRGRAASIQRGRSRPASSTPVSMPAIAAMLGRRRRIVKTLLTSLGRVRSE